MEGYVARGWHRQNTVVDVRVVHSRLFLNIGCCLVGFGRCCASLWFLAGKFLSILPWQKKHLFFPWASSGLNSFPWSLGNGKKFYENFCKFYPPPKTRVVHFVRNPSPPSPADEGCRTGNVREKIGCYHLPPLIFSELSTKKMQNVEKKIT